ncbi:hypothetical protein [Sphaerisporangium perillae]|uniref:hypothetical protein n=1 Tax=Sphaerisporangium perillae TaxID=2935860 RepID=UPI00200D8645|nr:hypothetical protein [Sphaerisporangium perillae]
MEPYRRDTTTEADRDPETGHAQDPETGHPENSSDLENSPDDPGTVYDPAGHARDESKSLNNHGSDERGLDDHGSDERGLGDVDVERPQGESTGMVSNPDPAHASGTLGDAETRGEQAEQRDLIVYPEEADYPTPAEDSSLAAGVPGAELDPVLVAQATGPGSGTGADTRTGTGTGLDIGIGSGVDTGAGTDTGKDHNDDEGADFERRWRKVQASFVDDPREAVERADRLADEAVAAITSRKQGLVDRWKNGDQNGDQNDTERLRLALRDYRSLLQELVGLSYSSAGHDMPRLETK